MFHTFENSNMAFNNDAIGHTPIIAVVNIFVSFPPIEKYLTKVERQLSLAFSKYLIAKGLRRLLSQFMDT